ncbi:MAG: 30S ribosomal protein S12 methylthiotransferase RimO [Anaerosomatales bacterium]|nr:30S ribosomal protein S12 methylthiotransferase RimO [Anaerosomatales bacterium]
MGTAPAIAFVTLGCPKNEVDSDRMRASVLASEYRVAADLDDADVVVLNTCGFITDAVEESVGIALELAEWRDQRPGRTLVVAGCMVSRYGDDLAAAMPEADAFVPVADEPALLRVLQRLTGVSPGAVTPPGTRTGGGVSEYLQVSDGCFRSCAYCTIPAIRGPYRSRSLEELTSEAAGLLSVGARELVLIGQDTSSWGRDLAGSRDITDVLRALAPLDGLAWLRLMYVQPDTITPQVVETMATLEPVRHYLDMPLQHASARVLRDMHRSGSGDSFLDLIARLRVVMPDIVLRSTFIAGYPGETEAEFEELLEFIGQAGLDYVGIFPYSPEEGTDAAGLPGQIPEAERFERANRVREVADEVSVARAARLVGTTLDVLSEGEDPDGVSIGRWGGQAPEVDGYVMLDRPVDPGRIVAVRIDTSYGYDLEGEVVA